MVTDSAMVTVVVGEDMKECFIFWRDKAHQHPTGTWLADMSF